MGASVIAYFAAGGLFTALYSNAVRGFPYTRSACPCFRCCCGGGFVLRCVAMATNFHSFMQLKKKKKIEPQLHLACVLTGALVGYQVQGYVDKQRAAVAAGTSVTEERIAAFQARQ